MISLPLYVIERVNGVWVLYNTRTCEQLEFNTRLEAETKLKELAV